jgi:UDP-2,3-diacylglucosamine hydrolase
LSDAPAATATPALPAVAEMRAPAAWQAIDFLSDLHLADGTPRTFEALATHLRCTRADAVFILGDLFEVWLGDDARHEGFAADIVAMLAEASMHRVVGFMAGNRDFLVGHELLAACGVLRLADPTLLHAFGERLLLTHGDALCLADESYQRFRAQVRTNAWQREFLALPLDDRRLAAGAIRAESQRLKAGQRPQDWADVDAGEAARWLRAAGATQMVHGHTHRPGRHEVAPGLVRHVLSDWDLDHTGSARADVLRWQRDGLHRIAPATAA